MSKEELKNELFQKIKELQNVRKEITMIGKEFGLERYFRDELTQYLNVEAIEKELYGRINREIIEEGIFHQDNTSQPPRFNGDMIKDIKSKNYEVELVKESGDYLPVTYRQVKGIGYSPDWKCDQQYIPFMKEFRARKRAEK